LQEKKEMDLEYVALKQNFLNAGDDLIAEKSRNEKIGLELLNLVNAKAVRPFFMSEHHLHITIAVTITNFTASFSSSAINLLTRINRH
jgi:hypothetical protein